MIARAQEERREGERDRNVSGWAKMRGEGEMEERWRTMGQEERRE